MSAENSVPRCMYVWFFLRMLAVWCRSESDHIIIHLQDASLLYMLKFPLKYSQLKQQVHTFSVNFNSGNRTMLQLLKYNGTAKYANNTGKIVTCAMHQNYVNNGGRFRVFGPNHYGQL